MELTAPDSMRQGPKLGPDSNFFLYSEARVPFLVLRVVCGAIFAASGASGEAGERPEDPRNAIVRLVDYGTTRVNACM